MISKLNGTSKKVKENQQVALDFNGRKVETTTGKADVISKDETLKKWGGEDAEHPGEIIWAMRVNYAKKDLVNVKVSDTWDENQEYVKDSFRMVAVESTDPWKEKESEATKIAPVFHTNGFTWSADKLSDHLYISYRTKVIKQAERYLNSVVLGADSFDSQYRDVPYQFVSGKGKADGENKPEPTFEIPKESPKVEIPEFQGGIPGIPEVREKPEYTEHIGTVPNEAPVLDKPEYPIPAEPEKPNTPPTTPEDKPKTPAPNQYVPIRKIEEHKPVVKNIPAKVIAASKKVEDNVLPNTGESLSLIMVVTGVFMASAAVVIKRKEN